MKKLFPLTQAWLATLASFTLVTSGTSAPAPAPAAVPEYFVQQPLVLPPPQSVYISPAQWHALYAQGIIIRDVRHRRFTQGLVPPPLGGTNVHNFGSQVDFEVSTDNGANFQPASGTANVIVRVTHTSDVGGKSFFDTEMLALNLSSGGIMLRESPTLASTGQATTRPVPGGYMVSSFFDIFTELSMDNGNTWLPAQQAAHVELRNDPALVPPVSEPTPLLPPPNDEYVSPAQWHALFAQGIVIKDVKHKLFTDSALPPAPGTNHTHQFNSQLDMQVSMDGGQSFQAVRASALVQVQVSNSGSGTTGLFDTEMTSLSATLPGGVMVRESPTEPSRGATQIDPQADGTFRISSFFDIFPEVSLNGGSTWAGSTSGPVRVQLTQLAPESPAATPNLPPPSGEYVSPQQWHALYANGIIISNVSHKKFLESQPPPPTNSTQVHIFGSQVEMEVLMPGQPPMHVMAPAAVNVQVSSTALDTGNTRFFDTEMLALNIAGGGLPPNVLVRESPSKASLGRTSVRLVPADGTYEISSFFDIFTELSLDGGQTWSPSIGEPASMALQPPAPCSVAIRCPANRVGVAPDSAGAVVIYPAPTVVGNCGPFNVVCNPPSGSVFPVGTTTVTCTVTDSRGNSATCSFTVTVTLRKRLFFPGSLLPPPNGMYISPAQWHALYANGIIISNVAHRRFTQSLPAPAPGTSATHRFNSEVDFDVSVNGGMTFTHAMAPAAVSVNVVAVGLGLTGEQVYDTEMLQLDISGGTLPAGVMIRESPTLASTGQTEIQAVPGGYMISSFFDVFTEVSLDGGQTWSPSDQAGHVDLRVDPTTIPPTPQPTPLLPPPEGQYVSPAQWHALYAQGIVIKDVKHKFFTHSLSPLELPIGGIQIHQFDSIVDCQVSLDGGNTFRPMRAPAAVTVSLQSANAGPPATFDTEMLQLDIMGGDFPPNIRIRESPTLASQGGTAVEQMADGTYRISSFFDIFTELSADNGQTWQPPTNGPAHVELQRVGRLNLFPQPNLPPTNGQYISPQQWHALYANGIIISNVSHRRFTQTQPPPPPGGGQMEQFSSTVDMMVSMNNGQTFTPYSAPAAVMVQVNSTGLDTGNTRYFDTEMLALTIAGGNLPAGVMIRESPSKMSTGRTSVTQDPASGGYRISSFFDVFTEMTLNGGQDWSPMVSEPGTVSLVPLGPQYLAYYMICPANITVSTGDPKGAVVNYPLPTSGPPFPDCPFCCNAPTCNPPPGSQFPLGTTTVNCSGVNGCGERASCSFQVKVQQTFIYYGGLAFSPLGSAVLQTAGSSLVISNLGSSGQDGYHLNLGAVDKAVINYLPFPTTYNTCIVHTATGPYAADPNHVLAVSHYFGGSNPVVRADFSSIGVTSILAQVRDEHGQLVSSSIIGNATWVDINNLFPPCNNPTTVYTYSEDTHGVCYRFCKFGCNCIGTNCYIERVVCLWAIPINRLLPAYLSGLDVHAQGVSVPSSLTIMSMEIGKFGNLHTAKGQTLFDAAPAILTVNDNTIGGNALFGAAVELNDVSNFDMTLAPTRLQSAGAYWNMVAFGRFNGMANVDLGSASVVHSVGPGGGCDVSADFGNIGASSVLVQVYQGSQFVGSSIMPTGALGTLINDGNLIGCGKRPFPLPCFWLGFDSTFQFNGRDGSSFSGDQLRILAADPAGVVQSLSLFCVQAQNLSQFAIIGEAVPPPIEVDTFSYSQAQITLSGQIPGGGTFNETVNLSGPATVNVHIGLNGETGDSNNNGLDDAQTEMTSLLLTGISSNFGPVSVTLNPALQTLGLIEELSNNVPGTLDTPPFTPTGSANSFFDVYFNLQAGPFLLHNDTPVHLTSIIHHKPPNSGEPYTNPFTQPIPLVDPNGQPTGIFIVREVHTPAPTNCVSITCPSNITVCACANGTSVTYQPTAQNTCGSGLNVACDPPSGSFFLPGTTTVTCTATDNIGNTARCSFTITVVKDITAPQLTCPSNMVIRTCSYREVVFYKPTVSDNCDPNPQVVCNPPSGSVFNAGTNVVTCVATDKCGNQSRCAFTVAIVPEAAPKLAITTLPNGQFMICWQTACPGVYQLQCAKSLNLPITWETVTNTVQIVNGQYCVVVDFVRPYRYYRLVQSVPQEAFTPTDTLPPPGSYNSPPGNLTVFANGLVARWFVHRILPPIPQPPPCLTCPNVTVTFDTVISFQHSTDGGRTFADASTPVTTSVRVHPTSQTENVRSFDTEMLSMNITGGTLPSGVMIRESPTLASTGKHTIRAIDGGFMVSSFFDVFLELSVDGGQTWSPSLTPIHVDYSSAVPENFFATDTLPPIGSYNSLPTVPSRYANGLITRWIIHRIPRLPCPPLCPDPAPCLTCPPIIVDFPTKLDLQYSTDGGQTFQDASADVQTRVMVRHSEDTSDTRFFDTEMLSLQLSSGPGGLMLRESPTLPSKGKTTIRTVPGGFMISSFFDVFTEVSLDNGQTWSPVVNPTHVELIPAPPEQTYDSDTFPPIGSYLSPTKALTIYPSNLVLKWFIHQIIPPLPIPPRPPPCLSCPPDIYDFPTIINVQVSQDGGKNFQPVSLPLNVMVSAAQTMASTDTRFFDTEMLALDVPAGVNLPVRLRESPSKASLGKTSVRTIDGGFMVSSFFDVFVELSLDGGQTWLAPRDPAHVELLPTPPENFYGSNTFPPLGAYNSSATLPTHFDNGLVARWFVHRIIPPLPIPPRPPPCLSCPPEFYQFPTTLDFQYMVPGQAFQQASAAVNTVVKVTPAMASTDTSFFDTEMLSLDLVGTLPGGVMIRESPTLASTGKTSVRTVSGGYMVGSFFDVNLEVSLDGGQTWAKTREPAHVTLVEQPTPVSEQNDTLPPAGSYNSPSNHLTRYLNGLIVSRIRHPILIPPIIPRPSPCLSCPPETIQFATPISFDYSMQGTPVSTASATSVVVIVVSPAIATGNTRFFDTEMLQLNISGGNLPPGVMLRESPSKASLGKTSIQQNAAGGFMVSSFFDVFTEVSLDGGQTWSPSLDSTHLELNP